MKKILIIFLVLTATAATAGTVYAAITRCDFSLFRSKDRLRGSGHIVSQTFEAGTFHTVDADHNARVTLVKGSGPVVVRADDNLMPHVVVENRNGELEITLREIRSTKNVTFDVTVPTDGRIRSLDASGAAQIISEPVLTADEIGIEASGASKIVAALDCREAEIDASGASRTEIGGRIGECDADASGASHIKLVAETVTCHIEASGASSVEASGSTHDVWIEASGASTINAGKLSARDCTVDISGASQVSAHCTGTLKGEVSGAGKLAYTGDCRMLVSRSSAGSVSRK